MTDPNKTDEERDRIALVVEEITDLDLPLDGSGNVVVGGSGTPGGPPANPKVIGAQNC